MSGILYIYETMSELGANDVKLFPRIQEERHPFDPGHYKYLCSIEPNSQINRLEEYFKLYPDRFKNKLRDLIKGGDLKHHSAISELLIYGHLKRSGKIWVLNPTNTSRPDFYLPQLHTYCEVTTILRKENSCVRQIIEKLNRLKIDRWIEHLQIKVFTADQMNINEIVQILQEKIKNETPGSQITIRTNEIFIQFNTAMKNSDYHMNIVNKSDFSGSKEYMAELRKLNDKISEKGNKYFKTSRNPKPLILIIRSFQIAYDEKMISDFSKSNPFKNKYPNLFLVLVQNDQKFNSYFPLINSNSKFALTQNIISVLENSFNLEKQIICH